MFVDPLGCCLTIANGFVGNIDNHVIFLADQGTGNIDPVIRRMRYGARRTFLTTAGGIVHFQHTDHLVRFTQGNYVSDVCRTVTVPAVAITEYHANRVRAQVGDIRDSAGFTGKPGMRMVSATHYKIIAVTIEQARARYRESRPGLGCYRRQGEAYTAAHQPTAGVRKNRINHYYRLQK